MKKNYFSAFLTRLPEFLCGYPAVLVIQFNGYKSGAGPGGRGQVYLFPAPKIKIKGVGAGGVPGGGVPCVSAETFFHPLNPVY